jgi:hypothetical protein
MAPKRGTEVREPVQVYLAPADRALLDRVAEKAGLARTEVLRLGLRRVAAEFLADENPMLALIREQSAADWPAETPRDVAQQHDRYLAESRPSTQKNESKAPKGPKSPPRAAKPRP